MRKLSTPKISRRRLMIAGAGAAGAFAAGSALPGVQEAAPPAATDTKATPDRGGGYRVTEHVLRYYRTTRI